MFTLSSVSAVKQASYSKRADYNREAVEKRERQRNTAETRKRGGYQHRNGIRLSETAPPNAKPLLEAIEWYTQGTPMATTHGQVRASRAGIVKGWCTAHEQQDVETAQ